jgi:hypothetical protein
MSRRRQQRERTPINWADVIEVIVALAFILTRT